MKYIVYKNKNYDPARVLSAKSKVEAASIFLGQEALDKPRREGDNPACFVKEVGGDETPFWRASSEVRKVISDSIRLKRQAPS